MNMGEVKVTVMGPDPPCVRCQAAKKVVEKVAEKLRQSGINVQVERVNIMSKEVVRNHGVLVSPAVIVNGTVKIIGRIPSEDEVEKLLKEAAQ
jgi:glutaredoxin